MRETSSVILHSIIVHVLDKTAEEPLLTDFQQEITEEIHELIEKHIVRSLKDDDNRIAKFITGPNIVRDSCDQILYHESSFVESSKIIAQHLFRAMKVNANTSSCDLVICSYSVDSQKYVGILKMDYRKSYVHDIEYVDDRFKVSIISHETGLPGMAQRLQKCAFIKRYEANDEYDLVLLDKQQAKGSEQDVAHFFAQDFLNCNILVDSKDKTKMFRSMTEKFVRNELRQDVAHAATARDVLATHLNKEEEINVRQFAEAMSDDNEEMKNNYIEHLNNEGFQVTGFEVNKEWVEKKLKRKAIKTDTGFDIRNERDIFNDPHKFSVQRNGDGTINIVLKNIRNFVEK
ncbi:conserved hypothetical protein [Alkaliphilus metalliredigens QYMF]|uniref:Nucleoid-associated protein n=1 Tax=Alkaliphilus metalliredigens (strain QYMF) TaxID=293826 RepID=A6TSZ2_ALKMQ|nr:nucleoid-associated protein [Alkaliphilus metalliredigens]ABR49310.1 conserved hypothetical protein [Alkaliphilus metalliredigens QYMF]